MLLGWELLEKGVCCRMIRKNLVVYLCILVAFLFNVYMILFRVGVDQISYAGFHKDTNLGQYLYGISNSLFQNMKWNTLIAGLLLLMMLLCYQLIEKYNIRKYLSLCAILVCAMVLQLVAHARSQMWERYLFPYIIAYALLFVLLGYHIFEKDKFRRKIYFAVLLALLGMTDSDCSEICAGLMPKRRRVDARVFSMHLRKHDIGRIELWLR